MKCISQIRQEMKKAFSNKRKKLTESILFNVLWQAEESLKMNVDVLAK